MTADQVSSTADLLASARSVRHRRRLIGIAILGALLAVLIVLSLCIGKTVYSPVDVVTTFFGGGPNGASFAINRLRLPRVLIGALAGLAFGMAGSTFQTMLRNPLASPDIIGISGGASAAAVIGITFFGLGGSSVSVLAVVAGIGIAALIYALAYRRGIVGARLILIGIGFAAMLHSVVNYALSRGSIYEVNEAFRWITGSLNSAFADDIPPLAISVAVLAPALLLLQRRLLLLELGDDTAAALGVRVDRTRAALILVAVCLLAMATATTGPIAFVAFLSGPIAARLLRTTERIMLPAALVGALLVLACDFASQHLLPVSFPVGVLTGIIGAPYLLFLLVRSNRNGGRL